METIYFFVGAVTVAVVFSMVWLLRIVSIQIKQIQDLERGLESVVSNDITESQVRAIVDSRVDKFAASVEKELSDLKRDNDQEYQNIYTSITQNVEMLIRGDEQLKRDLMEQININRVTNARRVTDGDLQSEY